MVEAPNQERTSVRTVSYAKWRTDKQAEPGHSQELINTLVEPEYYDNLAGQDIVCPTNTNHAETLFDLFEHQYNTRRHENFLGTRRRIDAV